MIGLRTPCLSWWNLMLHPQGTLRSRFFWPVIIGDIIGRSSVLTKVLLVGNSNYACEPDIIWNVPWQGRHSHGCWRCRMIGTSRQWRYTSTMERGPGIGWMAALSFDALRMINYWYLHLLGGFNPLKMWKSFGVIIPSRMEHPTSFKRPTSQNLRPPGPEKNRGSPRESLVAWFIPVLIRHLPYYWSPIPFLND